MQPTSRIYVAGHTGLIGSAMVRRLEAAGFTNLCMASHADLELTDVGTRPDNLKALALATGGHYADIDAAGEIADHIPRSQRRWLRVKRTEFWDSPWLFAAFLLASGFLTTWIVHRVSNL